ncbi:MAG: hypothetical protein HDT14_01235 [Oscillibacter sp.]|nr:hypothetical protein [Oscillibacter sp.]
MENKKTLRVSCATCDIRNLSEETLSRYEKVEISAATIITNQAAQALLSKYQAEISAAATFSVEGDVRFSTFNGPVTLSPGQSVPQEKTVVVINGPLTLEPGCEEQLKSYVSATINGPVTCPASMTGLLVGFHINGPIQPYPDGAAILKRSTVLDRFFHLRARQDALYYAAKRVIALAPDIDFARLAEKNVRFATRTLIVSESNAEAAVPLFDDKADIVVLPDGCAYVDDDAQLNEALLKRCGGKLYIGGDLIVGPDSAALLDQVSYLKIDGDLLVCRSLRDRVLSLDASYGHLFVVGGVLLNGRPVVNLTAEMLADAEDGLTVANCATVYIKEDVTPELLRGNLVSLLSCAVVFCASREQQSIVQTVASDNTTVSALIEADEEAGEIDVPGKDENVVEISAANYTF